MARTAASLVLLFAAGCSVGEVGGPGGDDDDGPPADLPCADRLTPANPKHLHTDDNTSKQGQDCIVAGCHLDGGGGAPLYVAAGTVFGLDGVAPSGGATIRIYSGGQVLTGLTDEDGNFAVAGAPLTFPARTEATACPQQQKMISMLLATGDGSCNNGACHGVGSSTGNIKLP